MLGIGIVFICAAFVGMIISIVSIQTSHIVVTILLCIFAFFTAFGIIDAYKGREKFIYRWLVRRANIVYDKVYNKLSEEYIAIAEGNNEKASFRKDSQD